MREDRGDGRVSHRHRRPSSSRERPLASRRSGGTDLVRVVVGLRCSQVEHARRRLAAELEDVLDEAVAGRGVVQDTHHLRGLLRRCKIVVVVRGKDHAGVRGGVLSISQIARLVVGSDVDGEKVEEERAGRRRRRTRRAREGRGGSRSARALCCAKDRSSTHVRDMMHAEVEPEDEAAGRRASQRGAKRGWEKRSERGDALLLDEVLAVEILLKVDDRLERRVGRVWVRRVELAVLLLGHVERRLGEVDARAGVRRVLDRAVHACAANVRHEAPCALLAVPAGEGKRERGRWSTWEGRKAERERGERGRTCSSRPCCR